MDLDGVAYSPGYVLHDGYLSIATTDNMLKRIIQLQNGEGDSLASDDEYRRISQYIEKERDLLVYFNLHRLARLVENYDELELSNSQQRLLQESLGSIAMSTTRDDRYNRFKAAMTLFPETE
ncbi:MAG: hypothetical protein F4Y44_11625 [Chloroflexi bacterium]|nr:hypothetical protein [Chloroflexota bacterium]